MNFSVVIPTCGRAESLARALRSLAGQTNVEFEAIVVCDGPDEATSKLSREMSLPFRVTWVFLSQHVGPAAARNAGVEMAHHEILAFLDDDSVAGSNWIAKHARHHVGAEPLVVLGRVKNAYDRPTNSYIERHLRAAAIAADDELHVLLSAPAPATVWVGLNTSLPRSLFLHLGGFDAVWEHVFEDIELGRRATAAAVRFLYEPEALVTHHETKNLTASLRRRAVHCGGADVTLARKGQASFNLCDLDRAAWWERGYHLAAWYLPGPVLWIAQIAYRAAEWTGIRFFCRIWARLQWAVGYWRGVRETGITRNELRRFARQPAFAVAPLHIAADSDVSR